MAYFSNGTEGELYREHYCYKCEHFPRDDESRDCPIWSAHFFYAYSAKDDAKAILDMLIPMVPHTFKDAVSYPVAGECTFFKHGTAVLPFEAQR